MITTLCAVKRVIQADRGRSACKCSIVTPPGRLVYGLTIDLTLASVPNYGLDDGELKQVISTKPAGMDGRSISGRRAGNLWLVWWIHRYRPSGSRATARKAGLSLALEPEG